jgi:hypothetical protein
MPYSIRKAKCKQSDGDSGSYTLSYVDNKGKKHRNCHTSRQKAKAQIAAIEIPEGIEDNWVPLAAHLTEVLEEELATLAGDYYTSKYYTSKELGNMKINNTVLRKIVREEISRGMSESIKDDGPPSEASIADALSSTLSVGQEIRIEDMYELVEDLFDAPGLDKSMVFRAIAELVENGVLRPVNRGFLRI